MKAITIWQPWATLISEGLKPYEFRAWPAPKSLQGTRIAIHAGARPADRREMKVLAYRIERGTPLGLLSGARELLERWLNDPAALPLSSIVCTATLGKPIRDAEMAAAIGAPWENDSDRSEHSNWGWPLLDIERLMPPLPARCAQGFWNWGGAA